MSASESKVSEFQVVDQSTACLGLVLCYLERHASRGQYLRKLDEIMTGTGLEEQRVLECLAVLENTKLAEAKITQEGTGGPFATRFRFVPEKAKIYLKVVQ